MFLTKGCASREALLLTLNLIYISLNITVILYNLNYIKKQMFLKKRPYEPGSSPAGLGLI